MFFGHEIEVVMAESIVSQISLKEKSCFCFFGLQITFRGKINLMVGYVKLETNDCSVFMM